jgi:hypothetical protein
MRAVVERMTPAGGQVGVFEVGVHPGGPVGLTLAVLEATRPSAETVAALAGIDLDGLDGYDRVTTLQLWERHSSWVCSRTQDAIVAVGGAVPTSRDDYAREEVAAALRLSFTTAGSRLATARDLAGRLPETRDALAAGRIGYWHAHSVAEATATLDAATAATLERAVLSGGGPDETLARFRRRLRRALIAVDPAGADQRHLRNLAQRRVGMAAEPDGMASIYAYLAAHEAVEVMAAVNDDAYAARNAGDGRGIDALRADALVRAFTTGLLAHHHTDDEHPDPDRSVASDNADGANAAGDKAAGRRRRALRRAPLVQLTMDAPTALGLADHPVELHSYGPIPPGLARRLAQDADWQRFLTDPESGQLLDVGRTRYRPPESLAEFTRARDQTCRFPGCNQPGRRCDIDHVCAWSDDPDAPGGETCRGNTGPACRRHHNIKTHGGWGLTSDSDGLAVTWRSPLGRSYRREAPNLNPEHTNRLRALGAAPGAEPATALWRHGGGDRGSTSEDDGDGDADGESDDSDIGSDSDSDR